MESRCSGTTLPLAKGMPPGGARRNAGESTTFPLRDALTFRYMHFQVVPTTAKQTELTPGISHFSPTIRSRLFDGEDGTMSQPGKRVGQWINCDLRRFDYSVLGKCVVAMDRWVLD
jgi:hypothetical protein